MSKNFLSCNGSGLSPGQVISGIFSCHLELPDWFQFKDRDIIFTYQGRYAVGLICRIWNIGHGDEVLVPAYNCGAEVDPFVWAGAKTVLYRVGSKAAIDIEDIFHRVTPATRLIYITHFFGWPQEIRELAEWCNKKRILLVEDCAQSLFSGGPDDTITKIGDAIVFSFVKSLPTPDGGALVIKKNILRESRKTNQPQYQETIHRCLVLLKKWFMHRNRFWQRHEFSRNIIAKNQSKKSATASGEIRPEMLKSNYFEEQKIDWDMSRITRGLLSKTNPEYVIKVRRRNYQYLHNELSNIPHIKLLFNDLPANVCPLSFPVFFKSRKHAYEKLSAKGILVQGWPGYYPGLNWDEFPEACNFKDNLVTLPVHQDLDIHHMEYIAECVKSIGE